MVVLCASLKPCWCEADVKFSLRVGNISFLSCDIQMFDFGVLQTLVCQRVSLVVLGKVEFVMSFISIDWLLLIGDSHDLRFYQI